MALNANLILAEIVEAYDNQFTGPGGAERIARQARLREAVADARQFLQDPDYVRARTVFAVTVEDACGRRRKVGVRASTRRVAWDTAALMCGDEQPVGCKEEDRSVDFDAGR